MDGAFSHDRSALLARHEAELIRRELRLEALIGRQELFQRGQVTHHGWTPPCLEQARSVWFGLGLAGRELSRGLPIDVAVMLLAQDMVRRELGLARSEILLADENALAVGWSELDVRRIANRTQRVIEALIETLGLNATVIRASELANPRQRARMARMFDPVRPYVGLQLAQVEGMRRRGATIKLGWTLGRRGFDETSFDRHYRRRVGGALAAVYTTAGRRLDLRRPRACPYVCSDPNARILVDSDRSARETLADADPRARAGYVRLLAKISRAIADRRGERAPADPVAAIDELLAEARRHGGGW